MKNNALSSALLSLSLLSAALLTSGCGPKENSSSAQVVKSISAQAMPSNTPAEYMTRLPSKAWLSVSEEYGLAIIDSTFTQLDAKAFSAEYFDSKIQADNSLQIASFDAEQHKVVLAQVSDNQLSSISYSNKIDYALEGLCLYQPKGSPLQLFLLDENQIAHQLLVSQQGSNLELAEIRTFALPPGSENCLTDDGAQKFYFTEENIGLWQMDARSESATERKIVDLVKPFGQLANVGPMVKMNQHLVIAEDESNALYVYSLKENKLAARYSLPESIAIKTLSASGSGDNVQLVLMNDNDGQLYRVEIAIVAEVSQQESIINVSASGETTPVKQDGDAADDPAIWLHPTDKNQSKILGTNKKYGLYVYDLTGQQVQELVVGRVNNVDVRQGFSRQGKPADIAAASQRDRNAIALFSIDPLTGEVDAVEEVATSLDDIYGLCMYRGLEDKVYVFANDADGRYQQYLIKDSKQGWQGELVREFAVETQPEGCTVDERDQRLFVGEEGEGIWLLGAEPTASTDMISIAKVNGEINGDNGEISDKLHADVEGIELYQTDEQNILVVSSQGNDSYVLLNADAPYQYLGRFRVGLNAELGIDGASETDGLTVTPVALNDQYPQGLLVVQDGRNLLPNDKQNFKLVSWQDVADSVLSKK